MNLAGIFFAVSGGLCSGELFNHSTLVLGYLLLYGYEVSGNCILPG